MSILLLVLLLVGCFANVKVAGLKGPRTEDLIMHFYSDVNAAYNALEAGEVDIVGFDIQEPIYLDAITNPNVVLAPVDDMVMYQFDINNNYSIRSYRGVRSPTNYKEFRQALAFLVDKDRVVDEFCGGFAARIDQPIAAPTHGWVNTSYAGANYPFEYDPAVASALLDSVGFTNGTTPNPYYDPEFPGSTTTLRTYPPDHSKTGQDLDDVIFCVRTDDPRRFKAGRHLYENARKIGVPCYSPPPTSDLVHQVFGEMDYHIYTGGWGLGRFPSYVYYFYSNDYYIPYGHNYVTGVDEDGNVSHPALNDMLTNIYYADTYEEALKNTRNAMGLFTELCVTIPLFSPRSFWAYSTELLGAVSMDGYSFVNDFFFLNCYKQDGSPIRWGVINPPDDLNIMYYNWGGSYYSRARCLDRIYDWAGYDLRPYDIVVDQPGFILDWTLSFWNDSGAERAMFRKEFRSDNYFVEAGSGLQLENVDVDTYLFSCYMHYANEAWWTSGWPRPGHMEYVSFFEKVSDYEVEVYFNTRIYWEYMVVSPKLLPMSVWLNASKGLTVHLVDDVLGGTEDSFLGLYQPVWVNSIISNVTGALAEWVDYRWESGDFMLLTDHVGELLTVDYYQLGNFYGYTPGNISISWREVESGSGMYYMAGYSPGVGGNFTARRNPFYYLETPILGEVDFVWEDGGYYEVTIFDIVKAAGAYGSQGIAIPDDNWFPGADLAPPGGVIDIFDIVTIAGKYGQTFGAPPP